MKVYDFISECMNKGCFGCKRSVNYGLCNEFKIAEKIIREWVSIDISLLHLLLALDEEMFNE